ncbi:hypothetical protein [Pseudomonas violetae]|uniref:Uncharacterized protein n=1 Tax=Pseudomonas violetae TaxID=2915813 RepID=A0ABT0ESD4_9PSED|nr:hypothetical protein [Pseudomonas violetae]MCK1788645.1 hypothetical protein [Pseudomonas violetae]
MTGNHQNVNSDLSLLQRSTAWLGKQPTLPAVRGALNAIVARAVRGELADDADCRDTCDALTEHYVDRGGDLSDLSMLPEPGIPQAFAGQTTGSIATAAPDYGALYPDSPAAAPLSKEEKRTRLQALRAQITRPGGF